MPLSRWSNNAALQCRVCVATATRTFASVHEHMQSLVSLFKTPEKGAVPAGTMMTPFGHDESPSERSTIPQLFTPEINAVLDLDASIKWRGPGEHGMSPLPAVTPLNVPTDGGSGEFRASHVPARSRGLRSNRALDFSNALGFGPAQLSKSAV